MTTLIFGPDLVRQVGVAATAAAMFCRTPDDGSIVTNVRVENADGVIRFVGCNTHVLVRIDVTHNNDDDVPTFEPFHVPHKALTAMAKLHVGKQVAQWTINDDFDGHGRRQLTVSDMAGAISERLVDGDYPNYTNLFPADVAPVTDVIGFAPDYMALVGKAINVLHKGNAGQSRRGSNNGAPALQWLGSGGGNPARATEWIWSESPIFADVLWMPLKVTS